MPTTPVSFVSPRLGFRFSSREDRSRESRESHDTEAADDDDPEEDDDKRLVEASSPSWRLAICCGGQGLHAALQLGSDIVGFAACALLTVAWLVPLWRIYSVEEGVVRNGVLVGATAFAVRLALIAPIADALRSHIYHVVGGFGELAIATARGPRHGWTDDMVNDSFGTEAGEEAVIAVDVLNGRGGRVLEGLLLLAWLPFALRDARCTVWACGVHSLLHVVLKATLLRSTGSLAAVLFHRGRIRDGRAARLNLLMADCVDLALMPLALLLLLWRLQGKVGDPALVLAFCLQPSLWGGAASEIVGTFCSRLDIELNGYGETKCRKSIEGAGACFAASFVACAVVAAHPGFPPAAAFSVSQVRLCAYMAATATLIDTVASRTTDNALMVLGAALVVASCFWPEYEAWMVADSRH